MKFTPSEKQYPLYSMSGISTTSTSTTGRVVEKHCPSLAGFQQRWLNFYLQILQPIWFHRIFPSIHGSSQQRDVHPNWTCNIHDLEAGNCRKLEIQSVFLQLWFRSWGFGILEYILHRVASCPQTIVSSADPRQWLETSAETRRDFNMSHARIYPNSV